MLRLKNEEDIKRLRESGLILGTLLQEIRSHVQEDVSLLELDRWAEDFIVKRGAIPSFKGYQGFPSTLCLSLNEVVIHGIPSKARLKSTDVLSVDCGVNLRDYYSDAAVTIALANAPKEVPQLLAVTQKALYAGIKRAVVGNRIEDIGRAIAGEARPYNYGVVYQYCGHGVGFSQHEEPNVPNLPEGRLKLKEGLVLAIEPMFNLGVAEVVVASDGWSALTRDNKISVHFEHTVAITKEGPLILTQVD